MFYSFANVNHATPIRQQCNVWSINVIRKRNCQIKQKVKKKDIQNGQNHSLSYGEKTLQPRRVGGR